MSTNRDASPRAPITPRAPTTPRLSTGALGLVLALPFLAAACSTTYRPRPSARVGLVVHGGGLAYVENGRETPVGPLGGDLPQLVASNPDAAAHARTARAELAAGVPAYLLGVGAVALGLGFLSGPGRWVALGTGLCVGGTGLGLMGAGFTHALDAVNLYNDTVR